MSVLYVFPEPFPNAYARGVQVAHSVCALAEQGARVDFYHVPSQTGDPFDFYGLPKPQTVSCHAGSRKLPGPLGVLPVQSNRFFSLRLAAWIRRRVAAGDAPDVIYVRHLKVAAALLAARLGVPLVYEAHEVFALTAKVSQRRRIENLERQVVTQASAIVANSAATAAGLRKFYELQRSIVVVPNGVSDDVPLPNKNWDRLGESIVYAGSFYGWKGVDDLIQAAGFLSGCRLRLIGGSSEQIEKMGQRAPQGGAVIDFVGRRPHSAVLEELANACIAVLPNKVAADSDYTCPLKLFEYMMAGCAIVATKIESVESLVGDDIVAWAKPNDPASLADAIRRLVENPGKARQMGERARERAQEFTWEARAAKIMDVLRAATR